jgi:hypothetical protein
MVEQGKRGAMATKLGESGDNGRTRKKGGDGRTKSTTNKSQEQGTLGMKATMKNTKSKSESEEH